MNKKQRIRKFLVYAVYIVFISSVQVSFSDFFSLSGQIADLMLVFVVISGYLFGIKDVLVVGLVTGFFRDYFSGPAYEGGTEHPSALLGVGMLLLLYAGVLSAVLFSKAFHRRLPLGLVQVVIITVVYKILGHFTALMVQIISGKGSEYLSFIDIITGSIIPQVVINLLAAIPVILMLRYWGPYDKGVNPKLMAESSISEGIWQIG
jgi:LytS/YehU family sensor histidine kinase